jgi:cell division protein FtsX
MVRDVVNSINAGIVTGLLGAAVWCVVFAVVLNVFSSSYVAVGVVFVLVGIAGGVNSYWS